MTNGQWRRAQHHPIRIAPPTLLTVWVVYDHPRDYPDAYVVRGQDARSDGTVEAHAEALIVTEDLDAIRAEMEARGLARLPRHPDDDPAIIETWL